MKAGLNYLNLDTFKIIFMNGTQEQGCFFKAVIFDMDGTLINSIDADYMAWNQVFSFYGQRLTYQEYLPLLGIKSAEVIRKFLPVKDEQGLREALAKKLVFFKDIIEVKGIDPVPYADVFLKQVKSLHIPLALATSSRKAKMKLVMEKVGMLPYFDVIVTAEDVRNGKPSPDIFLMAADRLSVSPEHCIVFEDAANGVKAAKNAAMKCVAVASGETTDLLSEADMVIPGFKGLDFKNLCFQLQQLLSKND